MLLLLLLQQQHSRRQVPSKQQRLQGRTRWQHRPRNMLLQALLRLLCSWRPSRLLPLHSGHKRSGPTQAILQACKLGSIRSGVTLRLLNMPALSHRNAQDIQGIIIWSTQEVMVKRPEFNSQAAFWALCIAPGPLFDKPLPLITSFSCCEHPP